MGDDLIPILARFHREVTLPDMKSVVADAIDSLERRLDGHFDGIYKRFDRLETEYHMLVAGPKRVEERLDAVERQVEKLALKSELDVLKARVETLQAQVQELEGRLSA